MNPTFEATLQKHNKSLTSERREVFKTLDAASSPLTMGALASALNGIVDRSTVYRTIELFESLNICRRVYTGWKYRVELSDRFSSHHHHITCTNCGRIVSFEETPSLEAEIAAVSQRYGFTVSDHTFELRGLCSSCC